MSIEAINGVSNVSFKGNDKNTKEKTQQPTEIKDGKKKLALALGGLAALATAGVVIATKIQKGKGVDEGAIEKGKEAIDNTITKQKATKGLSLNEYLKMLPTAEQIDEVGGDLSKLTNNNLGFTKFGDDIYATSNRRFGGVANGKLSSEYQWAMYFNSGEHAGKYAIFKEFPRYDEMGKPFGTRGSARIIYNPKTSEITKEFTSLKEPTNPLVLRTTKNGITTKNGEKFATQTIEKLDDGTKKITVEYPDGKNIFTISPDGTKDIQYGSKFGRKE